MISKTSVFVDHFAPIVGVWYQLEPVRLNWLYSPALLMKYVQFYPEIIQIFQLNSLKWEIEVETWTAISASCSLIFLTALCFSSSLTFSLFASSHLEFNLHFHFLLHMRNKWKLSIVAETFTFYHEEQVKVEYCCRNFPFLLWDTSES